MKKLEDKMKTENQNISDEAREMDNEYARVVCMGSSCEWIA